MVKKSMKNNQQKVKPSFGNVTPYAPDAEKAVLGALINFREAFDNVSFLIPDMFYDPGHQALFQAIVSLQKRDAPLDMITISQEIATMGKTEDIPIWQIGELASFVVSSAHVVHHALIIKQKYLQREAIQLALQIQSQAADDVNDIGDVLYNAEKRFEALQEALVGQQEASSYQDISKLFYEDLEVRMNRFNTGQQTGITTGLTEFNRMTSGFQGSELIILAARTAMGKTAMALHFAQSAAEAGVPVLIFSLEMPKVHLYNRSVLSQCDNIDSERLKTGDMMKDLTTIDKSVARLYNLPIYVDDNPGINMAFIRSISRLKHKKKQCGMIIIDYLQLINADKDRYTNREQEIATMSRQAKLIAKELNIPVILLSQLNRDVEKRQDKRPQLSDLRESGAIEQDADMVLFIHRPAYYGLEVTDAKGNPVKNAGELIIAKYRNGPTGTVRFKHNNTLTRIFDYKQPDEINQLNIFS